jgi:hypothetical protein
MLTTVRSRATLVVSLALAGALAFAGCAAATGTSSPSAAPTSGTQPQDGRSPGVSGLIAAASDGLLQVQSSDEQTAVSYDSDTTISAQQSGALSDLNVGDCVMAITPDDADAAASVTVTAAVDGECGFSGGGFPGGGGDGAPSGAPTDVPQDGTAPSGMPTDAPNGGPGGLAAGAIVSGSVTAISGDTITVDSRVMGSDDTEPADVVVGSDTVVTVTVEADASALVVGQCVTAQGTADAKGGFAATALIVSAPSGDGTCGRTGFPGPNGGS